MAIFHMTIKIVGRSKGKSIIAASAYLNGDVMKDYETGRTSYYTSKNEVVYTRLMMCENAPPEWAVVPEENIARFQKSLRYKRSVNKEVELEKFKVTFQKQKLWNEVLKVEKGSDAQLGRSFEFSLPKEWNRQEQIDFTTNFIQRNFVNKGMCADWSIHDKGDGNPHVHLLLTMRPFKKEHSWGNKEVKDWAFERDSSGQIIINPSHPNWWQDKKDSSRCGIRIPVLDDEGNQKVGARNRKQWKRILTDSTGWNNPKNCELWRSEWAKECNLHLPKEKRIDHRSFARQGKVEIPTIHEGTDARMIDQRFQEGKGTVASWKVEKNQTIKRQNSLLQKLQDAFVNVTAWLKQWKEDLDDIRREQSSYSHDGRNDSSDRGTAGFTRRGISGTEKQSGEFKQLPEPDSRIDRIKQRITAITGRIRRYRRNAGLVGETGQTHSGTGDRESAMERIVGETEQREQFIADTERDIAEIGTRIEKARETNERFRKLTTRRTGTGTTGYTGKSADGAGRKGQDDSRTESTSDRITRLKREAEQREQRRERASIKERLEANKRIVAEREEAAPSRHRGHSR
ncbi:MAG TPA: MobA/MobL family protein [Lachnospiraceae bacterium]|nr:MobA/MobL family protein [Lachnospiraceae bacterium]